MKTTYNNIGIADDLIKTIEKFYVFDDSSNLKFVVDSNSLGNNIALDFNGLVIDEYAINEVYNTNFTELLPVSPVIATGSVLTQESSVTQQVVTNVNPETISDAMMTRDVIIQLRINAGEGKTSDEFSLTFPYVKLT